MPEARQKSDPTTWGVSSLQLQRPANLYSEGAVRPWEEGVVHVSTEAVSRGLNVIEGLKGYWQGRESSRSGRFVATTSACVVRLAYCTSRSTSRTTSSWPLSQRLPRRS